MKRSVQREMRTIEAMIRIYCRHHHEQDLCKECGAVLTYAYARIEKCLFGPGKPACNKCTVHCYSPAMKEKVKEIMRFSGPKMVYRHPVMALMHMVREKQIHHLINLKINQ
jgi:hypothetical protein